MFEKSKKTKEYYNSIAPSYSSLYKEEQIKKIKKILDILPKKGKVLDLGAGSGFINDFLDLKKIYLISMDISENLLKLNNNPYEKILGDIHELPFEKNTFDFVLSLSVLQDLENPKMTLKEIKRVLKNESRGIISIIKISKKKDEIEKELKKLFKIIKIIEEEKDLIYYFQKYNY